jgi:molybdopterin/thiamine biosynthesis adenylyltransferase
MTDRTDDGLTDAQLLRYSRHILLDEIGVEGQGRLLTGHALIIGAGGLGSPAALYLGTAGVGTITIIDDDEVDLTNLQRQIAHSMERIGQPKAQSAAAQPAKLATIACRSRLVIAIVLSAAQRPGVQGRDAFCASAATNC